MAKRKTIARRLWRFGLLALGLVLVLVSIAPWVSATPFRDQIGRELEASLGRKVTFRNASFTLASGPGLTLQDVTIQEDPSFGSEPFAFVPSLEAHLRIDKLLIGRLTFDSIRLVDASLNLVRNNDGAWNVVSLINRLSVPRRLPAFLFPSMDISSARINFKFSSQKRTLYIAESDLTILPERSGKVTLRFSGSPARSDRAGNGFGHFRGYAKWKREPSGQDRRFEADLDLERSNLSELTTLFEGRDLGVHGTISSHLHMEGPAGGLHIAGNLRLEDVHRWDLIPNKGDYWIINYSGVLDLLTHQLDLRTTSQDQELAPVKLQLRMNQLLSVPTWSVLLSFHQTPLEDLLPLGRRMGLEFPSSVRLAGAVDGVVGYSDSKNFGGSLTIGNFTLTLPDDRTLSAAKVDATFTPDQLYVNEAVLEAIGGRLTVRGDYAFKRHIAQLIFDLDNIPVQTLKQGLNAWSGTPKDLRYVKSGEISGQMVFRLNTDSDEAGSWAGRVTLGRGVVELPGFALPLTNSQGRIAFTSTTFDLDHFTAKIKGQKLAAAYHYDRVNSVPEKVSIRFPRADLLDLQEILYPTLRPAGFLARLGVLRKPVPEWIIGIDLQGDLAIDQVLANDQVVGSLQTQVAWHGTQIAFSRVRLSSSERVVQGAGTVEVGTDLPKYSFDGSVDEFAWRGGQLSAVGSLQSSGFGVDVLRGLQATGIFSGKHLRMTPEDDFSRMDGTFELSFASGWPDLRLNEIRVSEAEEEWTGQAASQSDGTLILDLTREGQQRRVVSTLSPQAADLSSAVGFSVPQ